MCGELINGTLEDINTFYHTDRTTVKKIKILLVYLETISIVGLKIQFFLEYKGFSLLLVCVV